VAHQGGVKQFGERTADSFRGARNRDVLCRHLITHPEEISTLLVEHRFAELADLVDYVNAGIDASIAITDPYEFRRLCAGLADYYCRGWGSLNADALRQAAAKLRP
jgi:hypothetical protein